jgi:hypothetical protein
MTRIVGCLALLTVLMVTATTSANKMLPQPPQPPTSQPATQPDKASITNPGAALALGLGVTGLLVGGGVWLTRGRRMGQR